MEPTLRRGNVCGAHIGDGRQRAQSYHISLIVISIMTLAACASVRMRPDEARDAMTPVQVLVRNDGATDVTVFAYRYDQRMRIGEVSSHSSGVLTVPVGMMSPGRVQLMLHQLSGGDFVADEVAISPGEEHAELHVLDVLDESALSVAPGRMPR